MEAPKEPDYRVVVHHEGVTGAGHNVSLVGRGQPLRHNLIGTAAQGAVGAAKSWRTRALAADRRIAVALIQLS